MTKGVEFDFVVTDSAAALSLYEGLFDVERIEVTTLPKGRNEAVFSIYGTRFHMLDENPDFQLLAPCADGPKSVWFNVTVPDIQSVYQKALAAGCGEIQPVTNMENLGVSNAMFLDPFGYVWMLHQVHRELSFEERLRRMEELANPAPPEGG